MQWIFKLSLVLSLSFPLFALGDDAEKCEQLPEGLPISVMPKWVKKISWFGAGPAEIKAAPCRFKDPISDADLENYFNEKYPPTGASGSIAGMNFSNENPKLLEALKKLTVIPGRDEPCAWCRPSYDQKVFTLSPDCRTVVCASKAVFGEKEGLRMLYMMERFSFNSSHIIYKDSSPWKAAELDHAISTLKDLPSFMLPVSSNQKFTHYTRGTGQGRGDLEIIANASMEFYRGFDLLTPADRTYSIVHEWGHNLAHNLKLDADKEWLNLSGWVDRGGSWTLTQPDSVVSLYARENPGEDFAETVATYRYNPALLKSVNPRKYAFIKETIFQGIEYLAPEMCDENKSYFSRLADVQTPDAPVSKDLSSYGECRKNFMRLLEVQATVSPLDDCLQSTVASERRLAAMNSLAELTFPEYAKRGQNLYHWNDEKMKMTPSQLKSTKEDLKERFSEHVANSFVKSCKKKVDWKSRFLSKEEVCKKIASYSYFDATELNEVFGDKFLMSNNRASYDAYIQSLCLELDKKELIKCREYDSALKSRIYRKLP